MFNMCIYKKNIVSFLVQFGFSLIVNLCNLFFATFRKKNLGPNGSYINMFLTHLRNVCLAVILSVINVPFTPAYLEV